jgi:pyruvate dehydrogenase E2 component (dihydrolipoamide acetyltransferase)
MATSLVMPALEMAQESGVLVHWLKHDGDQVTKGEPVMEIETDKATVEIEAPGSGILGGILAHEGDVVPVGQTIAWILAPGETPPAAATPAVSGRATTGRTGLPLPTPQPPQAGKSMRPDISPLARKIAEEHGIDPAEVPTGSGRIQKADVLAHVQTQQSGPLAPDGPALRTPASPKARSLASERGLEIAHIAGSGLGGAVLAADVLAAGNELTAFATSESPGTIWRVMAEHMTESWTTVPHFFVWREVDASNLVEWRRRAGPSTEQETGVKLTYTDLLIKLLGFALRRHPRLNASWDAGRIRFNPEVNVGVAIAVEEGLIVPVVPGADHATLSQIATARQDLVGRAHARKLHPADLSGGTFTLTNLGMYNVDAFNAIVNTPQAAILAVGRIAARVVAINGQPAVRPMINLSLSCDHRVVDGARAAQFLEQLANLVEVPSLLVS